MHDSGLRSLTVVVVDDATEYIPTTHPALKFGCKYGDGGLLIDSLMVASTIAGAGPV